MVFRFLPGALCRRQRLLLSAPGAECPEQKAAAAVLSGDGHWIRIGLVQYRHKTWGQCRHKHDVKQDGIFRLQNRLPKAVV